MVYELDNHADLNVVYINVGKLTNSIANTQVKKLQKTYKGIAKVLFVPTRIDRSTEVFYKTCEYIYLVDIGNLPETKIKSYVKKYSKKFTDLGFNNITFIPARS